MQADFEKKTEMPINQSVLPNFGAIVEGKTDDLCFWQFSSGLFSPMLQSSPDAFCTEFAPYSLVTSMFPDSYFFKPLWKNHIANPAKNAAANSCAATQAGA